MSKATHQFSLEVHERTGVPSEMVDRLGALRKSAVR